tara:strand:- start:72 stop:431 length:360 start_codon:yes stop_codon:yes gene_type:complete
MGKIRKPEHRDFCSNCDRAKTSEEKLCNHWTFECEDCRVVTKNIYKYKITRDESQELYNTTNCKICESKFTKNGGKRRVIDHCHDTGKVRGAICRNCNTGLGMFGDSIELMKIALKHLE